MALRVKHPIILILIPTCFLRHNQITLHLSGQVLVCSVLDLRLV